MASTIRLVGLFALLAGVQAIIPAQGAAMISSGTGSECFLVPGSNTWVTASGQPCNIVDGSGGALPPPPETIVIVDPFKPPACPPDDPTNCIPPQIGGGPGSPSPGSGPDGGPVGGPRPGSTPPPAKPKPETPKPKPKPKKPVLKEDIPLSDALQHRNLEADIETCKRIFAAAKTLDPTNEETPDIFRRFDNWRKDIPNTQREKWELLRDQWYNRPKAGGLGCTYLFKDALPPYDLE
jgi:hypothetical protein